MFICYITLFALKISLTTDLWVAEDRPCFNENFMWKHPKTCCENNIYVPQFDDFFSSSWGFHFNFLRMLCQICVYFWSLPRYFKFPHSFIQNKIHFFFAQLKKSWMGDLVDCYSSIIICCSFMSCCYILQVVQFHVNLSWKHVVALKFHDIIYKPLIKVLL